MTHCPPDCICPIARLLAPEPVAVLLVFDAFIDYGADATEVAAAVAADIDIATIAAAHPLRCASRRLGSSGGDVAESVNLELRVPLVFGCDHRDGGGGERDGVGEGVGEEHCCGVLVLWRWFVVSSIGFC